MKQNLVNARITFRNSPIHVLERFTFKDLQIALSNFREHSGLEECVIVQTCNRVELFGTSQDFDIQKIKELGMSPELNYTVEALHKLVCILEFLNKHAFPSNRHYKSKTLHL